MNGQGMMGQNMSGQGGQQGLGMFPQINGPLSPCPGGNCGGQPPVLGFTGLPELNQMYQTPVKPGPSLSPNVDTSLLPIDVSDQPMPSNGGNVQYLNGFLRTQIGRRVLVEFLIGTNTLVDRSGILLAVGANYILINETETDDILACDFYNIKFIKFYY